MVLRIGFALREIARNNQRMKANQGGSGFDEGVKKDLPNLRDAVRVNSHSFDFFNDRGRRTSSEQLDAGQCPQADG
jgi:hypothetical protein